MVKCVFSRKIDSSRYDLRDSNFPQEKAIGFGERENRAEGKGRNKLRANTKWTRISSASQGTVASREEGD